MLLRVILCLVICVLLCDGQFTRSRRVSSRGSSVAIQRRTRNEESVRQQNTTVSRSSIPRRFLSRNRTLARIQRAPATSLQGLYDFLVKNGLNNLCKMLKQSEIENILTSVGSCTIFGPADDTFAFLPGDVWRSFRKDSSKKREFLMSHVVPGTVTSVEVRNDQLINAAEGSPIRFNVYENGKLWTVSGAQVLQADLRQGQYTVHIIDQFLYPPATMTNVDYVRGHFENFHRMLAVADPNNFLAEGTFTLFIPGDEAFRALPEFLYEAIFNNNTLLQSVLLNHIVPSTYYKLGLPLGGNLTSLDDNFLRFKSRRGLVLVNGIPILQPDISVTNGVIHVINRVILPPNVFEDCNCLPTSPASRRPTTFRPTKKPTTEQTLIFDEVKTTPNYVKKPTVTPSNPITKLPETTLALEVEMTTENPQTELTTESSTRLRRPSYAPLTLPPFESSRINGNPDVPTQSFNTPLPSLTENPCPNGEGCPNNCPYGKDCPEESPPITEFPKVDEIGCPYGENCPKETSLPVESTTDPKDTTSCVTNENCPTNALPSDVNEPSCPNGQDCRVEPQTYPQKNEQCPSGEICPGNSIPVSTGTETPSKPCASGLNCPETPQDLPTSDNVPIVSNCPEGQSCPKIPEGTTDSVTTPNVLGNKECLDGEDCPGSEDSISKDFPPESLCPVGNFCPEQKPPNKIICPGNRECPGPVICTGSSCTKPECPIGQICPMADSPLIDPPGSYPPEITTANSEATSNGCKRRRCFPKTTTSYPDAKPNVIPRKPSRKPPGFIRIPYGPLYSKTSPKPILTSTTPFEDNNLVTSPNVSIFSPGSTRRPPIIESRPQYGSENNPEERPSSPVTDYTDSPYTTRVMTSLEPETPSTTEKIISEYPYQPTNSSSKVTESTTEKSRDTTPDSSITTEDSSETRLPTTTSIINEKEGTAEFDDTTSSTSVTIPSSFPSRSPTASTTFETKGPFDFSDDILATTETPMISEEPISTNDVPSVTSASKQEASTISSTDPTTNKPTINQNGKIPTSPKPIITQPQEQKPSTQFDETKTGSESGSQKPTLEVTRNNDQTTKTIPDQMKDQTEETQETQQPTQISNESESDITQSTQTTPDKPSKSPLIPENSKTDDQSSTPISTTKIEDTTSVTTEESTTSPESTTKVPYKTTTFEPEIYSTSEKTTQTTEIPRVNRSTMRVTDLSTTTSFEITTESPTIGSTQRNTIEISTTEDISKFKTTNVPMQDNPEMIVPIEPTEQNFPSSISDVVTTSENKEETVIISTTLPSSEISKKPTEPESTENSKTTEEMPDSTSILNQTNTTPRTSEISSPEITTISDISTTNNVQDSPATEDLDQMPKTEPKGTTSPRSEQDKPMSERPSVFQPSETPEQSLSTSTPISEPTTPKLTTARVKPTVPIISYIITTETTKVEQTTQVTPKSEISLITTKPRVPIIPYVTESQEEPEISSPKPELTTMVTRKSIPILTTTAETTEDTGFYTDFAPTAISPQPEYQAPMPEVPELRPETPDPTWNEEPPNSIEDVLNRPNLVVGKIPVTFHVILKLFSNVGLTDILLRKGPYTLCVPTDAAFSLLPPGYLQHLQRNGELLRKVLLHHVITSRLQVASLRNNFVIRTYQGSPVVINVLDAGKVVLIGGSRVLGTTRTRNGVLYVTNRVFSVLPEYNLLRGIRNNPELSHFYDYVINSPLKQVLRARGPFTLAAPTNEAFTQLSPDILNMLATNQTALEMVLYNHMTTGAHYSTGINRDLILPTPRGGTLYFHPSSRGLEINDARVLMADVSAGNGVLHVLDKVLFSSQGIFERQNDYGASPQPTISFISLSELAKSLGVDTFVKWFETSGLLQKINDGGRYTVLAPTEDALHRLPPTTFQSLQENPTMLEQVLKYHVIQGFLQPTLISNDETLPTLLPGKEVRFNWYKNDTELTVSGAKLGLDRRRDNVVVQVINKVLYPPNGDVMATVSRSPLLQDLTRALRMTGMDKLLSGPSRPYTLFAPTEEAFRQLPKSEYMRLFNSPQEMTRLLKRHLHEGTLFSSGVTNGMRLPAQSGQDLIITTKPYCIVVDGVNVLYSDITATNGVVHVLNHLL